MRQNHRLGTVPLFPPAAFHDPAVAPGLDDDRSTQNCRQLSDVM